MGESATAVAADHGDTIECVDVMGYSIADDAPAAKLLSLPKVHTVRICDSMAPHDWPEDRALDKQLKLLKTCTATRLVLSLRALCKDLSGIPPSIRSVVIHYGSYYLYGKHLVQSISTLPHTVDQVAIILDDCGNYDDLSEGGLARRHAMWETLAGQIATYTPSKVKSWVIVGADEMPFSLNLDLLKKKSTLSKIHDKVTRNEPKEKPSPPELTDVPLRLTANFAKRSVDTTKVAFLNRIGYFWAGFCYDIDMWPYYHKNKVEMPMI
jgi:hypothetical protein